MSKGGATTSTFCHGLILQYRLGTSTNIRFMSSRSTKPRLRWSIASNRIPSLLLMTVSSLFGSRASSSFCRALGFRSMNGHLHGKSNQHAHAHTHTNMQTDRQTDRQTYEQTHTYTHMSVRVPIYVSQVRQSQMRRRLRSASPIVVVVVFTYTRSWAAKLM